MPFGAKIVGPTTMYNMDGEAVEQSGELPVLVLGRLLAEDGTWWYVVNTNTYNQPRWYIVPQEAVQFYAEDNGALRSYIPVITRLNADEPIYVRYPFEGENTPRVVDSAVGDKVVRLLFKASYTATEVGDQNLELYQAVYDGQIVWVETDGVPQPTDGLYEVVVGKFDDRVETRNQPIAVQDCKSENATANFPVPVYASSVYEFDSSIYFALVLHDNVGDQNASVGWQLADAKSSPDEAQALQKAEAYTNSAYDGLGYARYVLFPAPFRGYLPNTDLAKVPCITSNPSPPPSTPSSAGSEPTPTATPPEGQ
ncbi:MAG: hypothetical protein D6711_12855 [Chloroflexi bacterium]|nr:MAG: hypothetical protein D6711_12855 [Chloroflexota bacterium]